MERYSVQQHIKIVEIYYKIMEKFEKKTGSDNVTRVWYQCRARSLENIAAVRDRMEEIPKVSIPGNSQQIEIFIRYYLAHFASEFASASIQDSIVRRTKA